MDRTFAAAVAFATASLPLGASAQTDPTYLTVSRSETYQSLAQRGLTESVLSGEFNTSATVASLPFTFEFLGNDYDEVWVQPDGYVTFDRGNQGVFQDPYNAPSDSFPAVSDPDYIIAPFWNSLQSTEIVTATEGVAPNRVFYIEFQDFVINSALTSREGSFTVALFEADDTFEVSYGGQLLPARFGSPAGVMGYEGSGESDGLFGSYASCTSSESCNQTDFNALSGQAFRTFKVIEPELDLTSFVIDPGALPGGTATATITIENLGLNPANGVDVDIYLSTDDRLSRSTDLRIGNFVDLIDIPRGESSVSVVVQIPMGTTPDRQFYVFAEVDPDEEFEEIIRIDNVVGSQMPAFGTGIDIELESCRLIDRPERIVPGAEITFAVSLVNRGVPVTQSIDVGIIASSDAVFGNSDDLLLGQPQTGPIPAMPSVVVPVRVTVPDIFIPPGQYFPICQADSMNVIPELNGNDRNIYVGSPQDRFFISAPPVEIVDVELPEGQVGAPYFHELAFTGGSSTDRTDFTFRVTGLPEGLSVNDVGVIQGTPIVEGTSSVSVEVSDEATIGAQTFDLVVRAAPPLVFTEPELMSFEIGTDLMVQFEATGGVGEITYEQRGGTLPAGTSLSSSGALTGVLEAGGTFDFEVVATDTPLPGGSQSTAVLDVSIEVSSSDFVITTSELPNAIAGTAYSAVVASSGGVDPVSWLIDAGTTLPSGLQVAEVEEGYEISGTPRNPQTASLGITALDAVGRTASVRLDLRILPEVPVCPSEVDDRCPDEPEMPTEPPAPAPTTDSGGCQAGGGAAMAPVLLVGLMFFAFGRRRADLSYAKRRVAPRAAE